MSSPRDTTLEHYYTISIFINVHLSNFVCGGRQVRLTPSIKHFVICHLYYRFLVYVECFECAFISSYKRARLLLKKKEFRSLILSIELKYSQTNIQIALFFEMHQTVEYLLITPLVFPKSDSSPWQTCQCGLMTFPLDN